MGEEVVQIRVLLDNADMHSIKVVYPTIKMLQLPLAKALYTPEINWSQTRTKFKRYEKWPNRRCILFGGIKTETLSVIENLLHHSGLPPFHKATKYSKKEVLGSILARLVKQSLLKSCINVLNELIRGDKIINYIPEAKKVLLKQNLNTKLSQKNDKIKPKKHKENYAKFISKNDRIRDIAKNVMHDEMIISDRSENFKKYFEYIFKQIKKECFTTCSNKNMFYQIKTIKKPILFTTSLIYKRSSFTVFFNINLKNLLNRHEEILNIFREMFLKTKFNISKFYKYETTIDEKLIKKEKTRIKEDFKLKYFDPEVNPFYFIFHNNYSPHDFAVDTIECLLSIGCECSHILELVNEIYNELNHIIK